MSNHINKERRLIARSVAVGAFAALLGAVPVAFHLWTTLGRGDLSGRSLALLAALYGLVVALVAVLATVTRGEPIRIDLEGAAEAERPSPVRHPWAALRLARAHRLAHRHAHR